MKKSLISLFPFRLLGHAFTELNVDAKSKKIAEAVKKWKIPISYPSRYRVLIFAHLMWWMLPSPSPSLDLNVNELVYR